MKSILSAALVLLLAACGGGGDPVNNGTALGTQMGGSRQGIMLALSKVASTLAGSTQGSNNGTGTQAQFSGPAAVTTDGINLYVADTNNHLIRKVIISSGIVMTIAGTGSAGSTDANGTSASFNSPAGITTDGSSLYVADTNNHKIRKIDLSSGDVTTLAGSGSTGHDNGTGTAATFSLPRGITTDGTTLYVADSGNNMIRMIVISKQEVSTLAGSGTAGNDNQTGLAATFRNPAGITTDGTNLYVADTNNSTIRQIEISKQTVTTLAGTAGTASSKDGIGTAAQFNYPMGITTDGTNLYVADTSNHTLRQVTISGASVTTLAGTVGVPGSTNATGTMASFNNPNSLTTDGVGLYITDSSNHLIRGLR